MALKEADFVARRKRLVESLVMQGYITISKVAQAMLSVPRHYFVPQTIIDDAYADNPLGIGEAQTISAPHMVAIMCEKLDLENGQKVLEIGSGSGYHAAVVAEIIGDRGHVYTIERIPTLVKFAQTNIAKAGLTDRITVLTGDGSKGLPEKAPFDRIYVTAASPNIPRPLVEQLKDCGKLLVPVNISFYQDLIGVTKKGEKLIEDNYGGCVFVPLIGEHGYKR